jgi:large subunit ribosomal protein L19
MFHLSFELVPIFTLFDKQNSSLNVIQHISFSAFHSRFWCSMSYILCRRATRLMSTSTKQQAASKSQQPYPFSSTALTPDVHHIPPTPSLRQGKGLMEYLQQTLPTPDKREVLRRLFNRNSPARLLPGSIVTVLSEQAPTSFTGVLLAIRRRGQDTSFRVRNIIQRTGVEMQFFPNSPGLKEIKLIRKPPKGRMRRAKLFYLRDSPEKMSMIAGGKK